jgi:translation initiation factor IF-2
MGPVKEEKPEQSGARKPIELPASLTVRELAELLKTSPVEAIKQLMRSGIMASINQVIDYDTAAVVAADLGFEPREKPEVKQKVEVRGGLLPRPPVITILGHVDHGKTTLLDAIRQTDVASSEAGGITQRIGAYQVEVDGRKITFLDTPGHEAFTAMRARGAQATDIAVLVVAADDGVMPQTVEAINHARAANVPIVVAINKVDKPEANAEKVKRQLAEQGLLVEKWGGQVVCVEVSAKKRQGIEELLENLLLVADMQELKADPNRPAVGAVVEAGLDKTRGPIATLLVQNGTLRIGDAITVGDTWGRVKAMFNDKGKRVKETGPATPVSVLGLSSVPLAGEPFTTLPDERQARSFLQQRQQERQRALFQPKKAASLQDIYTKIKEGEVRELPVVLKTDVQGSIEPIRTSLEKLSSEKIRLRVIHAASGTITESDVLLALASRGIVIGFNTRPEPGARKLAETEGVEVRLYNIIYELVEAVERALQGMVEPTFVEVIDGRARVLATFGAGSGLRKVAGVLVTEGKFALGSQVRVRRGTEVLHEGKLKSLRRFKDNVPEVAAGLEAGVGVEGFRDFQEGDILEVSHREKAP